MRLEITCKLFLTLLEQDFALLECVAELGGAGMHAVFQFHIGRLQLGRHVVEGLSDVTNLVTALDGDPVIPVSTRDQVGAFVQPAQRRNHAPINQERTAGGDDDQNGNEREGDGFGALAHARLVIQATL